jgi:hypothetical protein
MLNDHKTTKKTRPTISYVWKQAGKVYIKEATHFAPNHYNVYTFANLEEIEALYGAEYRARCEKLMD